jgi:DNA invertase Pin-like site-specific DNA recombinase
VHFCYKRVSTTDQNLDRQLFGIQFDREYVEKVSGKDTNRPQLQAMLQNIREGDIVHVHELSRLGRSVKDLLDIVEQITNAGGTVKFHKENLEFKGAHKDPFQALMLNLLSSIAQFERELMLSRQREGIAIAKAKGRYKGKQSRFTTAEIDRIKTDFEHSDNKSKLAERYGITRAYLYALVKK